MVEVDAPQGVGTLPLTEVLDQQPRVRLLSDGRAGDRDRTDPERERGRARVLVVLGDVPAVLGCDVDEVLDVARRNRCPS